MSWKKCVEEQRRQFVDLAKTGSLSLSELCRRFEISRKTGYKWIGRAAAGDAQLKDVPRRSRRTSNQTASQTEELVIALRQEHPTWGPRKLKRRLRDLGHEHLPACSTFGRILKRADLISPEATLAHRPIQRFERAEPNQLWQMDFKGHFALQGQRRCHPLTVLDDCSRYLVGLQACGDELGETVQLVLTRVFKSHGMPDAILCDNGSPWGAAGEVHTALSVWLMRLGIQVLHGRPRHPQTQGKDERFHRTLKADLLARHDWRDLAHAQERFDWYRRLYNHDRPHEAIDLAVPAVRYRPSPRVMPVQLPSLDYELDVEVRHVKSKGEITFRNRFFYVGRAFTGLPVALRPTATDGIYRVCFAAFTLGHADLTVANDRPKGRCFTLTHPSQKCYP